MAETEVGVVSHWYGHLGVAGVTLSAPLRVGDRIHVKGHTSDFEAVVESMQIEHEDVQEADAGASVGINLPDHAREHDRIYKVEDN